MKKIPGLHYTSPRKFRFKQRLNLTILPPILGLSLKTIVATLKFEEEGRENFDAVNDEFKHLLLAFWHETLALALLRYRNTGYHTLTSYSYDGELAARVVRKFGDFALRGSSSAGGSDALRDMAEAIKYVPAIGLTPDGPRGPRRVAKPGIAILAARAQLPVLPIGFFANRAWRLNSWDRFIVPKPFAHVTVVYGSPIMPPADASETSIERTRLEVEKELNELQESAENNLT